MQYCQKFTGTVKVIWLFSADHSSDSAESMWFAPLLIFAALQGLYGSQLLCRNKYSFCNSLAPTIDWGNGFPPQESEMEDICLKAESYYTCLVECSVLSPDPLDTTTETINATLAVVKEVCNKESRLHREYLRSSECYIDLASTDIGYECGKKAEIMYNGYISYLSESEDVDDADRTRHRYCMERAYKMACVALEILEECGEGAQTTYLELVHRSKYMSPICSRSTVRELREEFIEFLAEDEKQEKNLLQSFNL
ncbi:uncharacterized protein CDAR_411941 [Caerostris darwini]|uniref:Uncharacterized protein n=1 Tax=Caerostris darwini TaxID=1538125 RepID=A0AAV4WDE7_9ARAC|nr:uncharacterized protein CDAR_411941 [Caerostris darwini]